MTLVSGSPLLQAFCSRIANSAGVSVPTFSSVRLVHPSTASPGTTSTSLTTSTTAGTSRPWQPNFRIPQQAQPVFDISRAGGNSGNSGVSSHNTTTVFSIKNSPLTTTTAGVAAAGANTPTSVASPIVTQFISHRAAGSAMESEGQSGNNLDQSTIASNNNRDQVLSILHRRLVAMHQSRVSSG